MCLPGVSHGYRAQLGVLCKLPEDLLNPLLLIIDKGMKHNWPQYWSLGNLTSSWLPVGCNIIHHHSLNLAIQAVFYAVNSEPIQAMNAVENGVNDLTKV